MLAKPSSSSSSTQPPDLHPDLHHLQQSHDNHLPTSARDSTDSGSCEEDTPVVSLGAETLNGSTYSGTGCYNLDSNYFMSDDDCCTSTPLNHLTSISERLQIHAAASEIVAVAVSSGADVELNLSGPLLLKDMPSNKYAKEKKQHKAYQRDAMRVITAAAVESASSSSSSGDEASSCPAAGVPELETASIDAQHQHVRGLQEEVDLAGAVRSADGVGVGVVGDEVTSHSLCATADSGSGTHQGLELLMGDSNSLMSLLNGVDCLESMLRSCSEHCLNDTSVMESADHSGTTTSSGHQQTMSEMSSSSPPKSLGGNSPPPNTRIGGDWLLSLPSPERDSILRCVQKPSPPPPHHHHQKKKTIRPTRIAASREELPCHMSSPFDENPPVSRRITAAVHWGSSPQITAVSRSVEEPEPTAVIAGSGGGDSGTGLLSVGLMATAEGKVVSADRNSSCGWSLLDDASFLQREGGSQMMWIDNHSEWTRFQERQAAATPCDMSSEDPHLLLLHDISALEAPEGLASSMANGDQRLLEDDDASLSGNPSVNNASLLFGAFMPDDLMASHSCFSNISKFVGFLKPDCAASATVGSGVDNRRARVDIEEQLLPQLKKQKQQQKLGIFAAVMASSKTSRSASRL